MKSKPYRFHPEAREEFREAIRWYRNREVRASIEFRKMVSAVVKEISAAPERWPKHLYGTRRFVLQRFPFSVLYLDDPEMITTIAVAHGKRKPGYWKGRV
jgi:plasmid stabilization system protein ParE